MDEQSTDKFTWVIENFSELKRKTYSPQFVVGCCYWRLLVFPEGNNVDHLSVYLDVANSGSLPSQWRRHARFTISVVNQFSDSQTSSKQTEHWFSATESDWGYTEYMPLDELKNPKKGFLLKNKLIVEADVEVLEVQGNLDILKGTMQTEGSAKASSVVESQRDIVEAEVQVLEVQGNLDTLKASVQTVGSANASSFVESKAEMNSSTADSEQGSSSPLVDSEKVETCKDVASVENPIEPLEAYETIETDEAKSNDAAESAADASKSELKFHTIDVNGFMVYDTQAEKVKEIFEKHPDMASNFRPKSRQLRTTYMNVLLDLIETLCRSPQDITEDDLCKGLNMLIDLEDVGLKLDWLKANFDEVSKRKERAGGARIGELEKEFEKLKQMMSDLEAKLVKEKEEVAAVKVPLSFTDLVSKLMMS